ncbi:hypothetical protein [Hoeflea prorocentri]|uniref:Uncharacterized protein n=1 Tax=Hoeflea prorocentri TaxID=1922333 RepID=A0A9X3ZHN3_9HYPH|nr:hypothetical protein [Hoeflea prorocentri]MCY6381046.1 hypothetical protein [Hoeflea prorocentri]MDA5398846.1 hypothetical protein [Hoeflea prorocentri]
MTQRAANLSAVSQTEELDRLQPFPTQEHSARIQKATPKENKTRTAAARDMGIQSVSREVVDFGEPTSGTGEEGWGRKTVSVARVSILDDLPSAQVDPPAVKPQTP